MEKNNSLIAVEKEGVFTKIKKLFTIMFGKNKTNVIDKVKIVEKEEQNPTSIFSQNLKEATSLQQAGKKDKLEDIIAIVEKEPKTLDDLSSEKLKIINDYYDKKIQEADAKINKLKSKTA